MHSGLLAAYYGQRRGGLPAGYARVSYIRAAGEQYIDSGQLIGRLLVVRADIAFTRINSTQVNGTFEEGGRADFAGVSSGAYFVGCSNVSSPTNYPADTARHSFSIDLEHGAWAIDAASGSVAPYDYPLCTRSLYIGARHESRTMYPCWEDVFGVEMDYGGEPSRRFVPCVRRRDNKPGLYDLCGSVCAQTGTAFYINIGPGADFAWG